jgi:uroporphyrinogen decarboxylase
MDAPTRVLKAINHQEPDRVPAFESAFSNNTIRSHYGFPADAGAAGGLASIQNLPNRDQILKWAMSNRELLAKSLVDSFGFLRRVKIDIGLTYVTHQPRMLVEDRLIDEFGRIMKLEPDKHDGTLILGYHGGYLRSFEDYEGWEHPDPQDPMRLAALLAGNDAQQQMKNEVFSVPCFGGMMEPAWEPFGLEVFSRILARPKQAKKVFDDLGALALELTKIMAENAAKLVLIWDDYGFKNGLFMSPQNYRTYVLPWLKRMCEAAHKRDCRLLLHSDGDLTGIFRDIINCGVDALNPIDPTTANPKYDIFVLHEEYGDRLTFVGNISPVMLSVGTIAEIKEYAKRLIRELASGGGFIFSSGHSINPAITVDRWEALMQVREQYGTYPIKVPK